MRGIDGAKRVLWFDVKSVDVIEPAVPCFRDDRQRPPVTRRIRLPMIDAPLNNGVAHNADAVRVGDHHGPFKKSGLFDPSRSGHFAVAVQRPPTGENGIVHGIFSARQHGGHPRSNGALPDLQFSLAGD